MNASHSDALVFFGATGDLAYKKIFPSLQTMLKRGNLNVPVIGVAKSGWTLAQLRARARESIEKHVGLDGAAFDTLSGLLRYVDGDYNDAATYQAIRKELGAAQRPAHYLAIPPALFGTVVEQLAKAGCTTGARIVVEKPFGRDPVSAQALNRILLKTFTEETIFRIDHYLGKRPVHNMVFFRFENAQGVPFYIRAGKSLPVTCTELLVRLHRPPTVFPTCNPAQNYFRFRFSPDITGAFGLTMNDAEEKMVGQPMELLASRHSSVEEADAYERVLTDAMQGDATLFAREDYVEEAWRIVDPVLKAGTPVYEYEPGTWGPPEVDRHVVPPGGWCNPVVDATK